MKWCEFCHRELPVEKRRGPPRKYHDPCWHEKERLRKLDDYEKHKVVRLTYARLSYAADPETINKRNQDYYGRNREKVLKQQKKYREGR